MAVLHSEYFLLWRKISYDMLKLCPPLTKFLKDVYLVIDVCDVYLTCTSYKRKVLMLIMMFPSILPQLKEETKKYSELCPRLKTFGDCM